MASSRRRNKRNGNMIWDSISSDTAKKIAMACIPIILGCMAILAVRWNIEKQEMEEQRIKLEKEVAAIFEEAPSIHNEEDENKEELPKQDTTIQIAMTGDILCGDEILADGKTAQGYDFNHQFEQIKNLVKNSDIAIGTMETNFTQNNYSASKKYNSPKAFPEAIKESGIGLVSLAHNHSLDYGIQGLKETKQTLTELGIETVGSKEEKQKGYVVKDIKGVKIAFLAYTYGFSNEQELSTEEKQNVNQYEENTVKQDLIKAKEESDFICVIMHWGEVNSNQVSEKQNQITDFLVANGVGAIIGSHPAVVEPMEVRKNAEGENVLIAYSLGNYISSLNYENSNLELILNVELKKQGNTGKVSLNKVTYTPIYVLDKGKNAENRFKLIDMRQTAKDYISGNTQDITKEEYNKVIKGIDKLEEIIRK